MAKNSIRQIVRQMYRRPSCPMAIIGPPGSGKTHQAKEAGEELGIPTQVFLASTCDETDIAGMPVYKDGMTQTITPDWGKKFGEQPGLLIFDEFNCARAETLNALLTLISDRTFPNGKDMLHPETIILALMNDATMVGNEELSPAMNNRFGWITMEQPSVSMHLRWFKTGFTDYETIADRDKSGAVLASVHKANGGNKPKAKPITIEKWREWLWEKDENGADLKDLYDRAVECELQFASDDMYMTERRVCTARSVEKLLYFAGDSAHVARYADWFLDDANAQKFKTAYTKQKNAAPNIGMGKGRDTYPSSDSPERLKSAETVNNKINAKCGLKKLFGSDIDENDD